MRSQCLAGLSGLARKNPNKNAASREFGLLILAAIPSRSQYLKDLADFEFTSVWLTCPGLAVDCHLPICPACPACRGACRGLLSALFSKIFRWSAWAGPVFDLQGRGWYREI